MNKTMKFSVDKRDAGTRIDIYLTKKISKFTRSFLKKIIFGGEGYPKSELKKLYQ